MLLDRAAGRALELAVDLEPLEEAAGVAQRLELLAVDEVVVDAVDLAGPRRPGRRRHRQPEVGLALEQLLDDGALADPRRAGDDEQDGLAAARSGAADDLRVLEQRLALVAAEPAQPAALADVELGHDPARLHLADAGQRLEHAHDLQLRERVVARRPGRTALEARASPALSFAFTSAR